MGSMMSEAKDPWRELASGVADRPQLAELVEMMRREYVNMLGAVLSSLHPDAMDRVRETGEKSAKDDGWGARPSAYARLLRDMTGGPNSVGVAESWSSQ